MAVPPSPYGRPPRSRDLLTWETGDPLGSVPDVPGPPRRTPAVRHDDGRWVVDSRPDPPADTGTHEAGGAPDQNQPGSPITAGCQYLWEVRVYVPSTLQVETNIVTDPLLGGADD